VFSICLFNQVHTVTGYAGGTIALFGCTANFASHLSRNSRACFCGDFYFSEYGLILLTQANSATPFAYHGSFLRPFSTTPQFEHLYITIPGAFMHGGCFRLISWSYRVSQIPSFFQSPYSLNGNGGFTYIDNNYSLRLNSSVIYNSISYKGGASLFYFQIIYVAQPSLMIGDDVLFQYLATHFSLKVT
jgi:hypothetical protein